MFPDFEKIRSRIAWRCAFIGIPAGSAAAALASHGMLVWALVGALAGFTVVGVAAEVVLCFLRPNRDERANLSVIVRLRGPAIFDRLLAVKQARAEPLPEGNFCLRVMITHDYSDSITRADLRIALVSNNYTEEEKGLLRFVLIMLSRIGHKVGTETALCSRYQPTSAFFAVSRADISRCQM
jgi:hypothetical protein